MKALYLDKGLRLADVPMPQPAPNETLIRIRQAGICNTDLELLAGYGDFSGIPGHEFVGEGVEGAFAGKRVVGEINIGCGDCHMCERGITSQCLNRKAIGIHGIDGAFAEYLVMPDANLHLVPAIVSDDEAVFVEPLAAALQVLEMAHISPSDHVIVIGAGKLGLLCAQVVGLTGADVVTITRRDAPARLLETWGMQHAAYDDLPRQQAQLVVDVTGNPEGFAMALELVEPRGTIVLKSTYTDMPTVNMTRVAVNEIRVVGSRCGPFGAALRLLEKRLVDVTSLIEGRYPIEQGLAAFEHAARPGALKVLLTF